jgi:hypothetical protein
MLTCDFCKKVIKENLKYSTVNRYAPDKDICPKCAAAADKTIGEINKKHEALGAKEIAEFIEEFKNGGSENA